MDRLTIMIKLLHYKKLAKIEMHPPRGFYYIFLLYCFSDALSDLQAPSRVWLIFFFEDTVYPPSFQQREIWILFKDSWRLFFLHFDNINFCYWLIFESFSFDLDFLVGYIAY